VKIRKFSHCSTHFTGLGTGRSVGAQIGPLLIAQAVQLLAFNRGQNRSIGKIEALEQKQP
jgi:hypothetical protein